MIGGVTEGNPARITFGLLFGSFMGWVPAASSTSGTPPQGKAVNGE
jgi:hypothetical protein